MRAMAYNLFSYLKTHPLISAISVLLFFTLPIFHMLMFFWPLIVSTVLGVLAVISFGWQSDDHATPIAGRGTAESARQPDIVAFPSHEENVSNVLLVGNQEVTWLEWLHNEDTQKLCTQEREPAVWDAYGCDGSTMASAFTHKDEAIDDTSLQAKDKGRLYACGSRGEGETYVVSTEENEPRAVVPPSTVLGGFRGTAVVIEEEETKVMNAPILTAEDDSTIHTKNEVNGTSAGEDEVAGIVQATNECNLVTNSLESTIDVESTLNKCVLEVITSLHVSVSTHEESTEDISHTSELKIADAHEQDALDLRFSNKTISPVLEVKGAEVHEMWHVVQQDQAKSVSNQFETQDPQWDVSDGEEDRSSLRFSFFHNSSLTPSEAS